MLITTKKQSMVCRWEQSPYGVIMSENTELIHHMKEELSHVHGDIEHIQRDMEALIGHLKNLDGHLHHLMGETEKKEVNPEPL